MKQVLYINGDSWLTSYANRVASSGHPLFKDILVINHSVPGSGNIGIINRTQTALAELKNYGIKPKVCIGLSEVGRDFSEEVKLVPPTENLTQYLKNILLKEIDILKDALQKHQHYICTAWIHNPIDTKSIIDFIDEDFTKFNPVYATSNGSYNWLNDRAHVLKISKESFVEAVENKQRFERALLNNRFINDTLHLNKTTSDQVYEKFFGHVLSTIGDNCDNY